MGLLGFLSRFRGHVRLALYLHLYLSIFEMDQIDGYCASGVGGVWVLSEVLPAASYFVVAWDIVR